MKKLLIVISFCTLIQSLSAQNKASIDIKAGFGKCRPTEKYNSPTSAYSHCIGLESAIPLKEGRIYINPSVDYSISTYLGGKTYNSNDEALSIRVHYVTLSVPLLLYPKKDFIYIGVGPYIAYAVSGKLEPYQGNKTAMKFGDGINDNRKKIDRGITLKTGTFLGSDLGYAHICISANIGQINLVPNVSANTQSLKTFLYFVQVSFPLSKKD